MNSGRSLVCWSNSCYTIKFASGWSASVFFIDFVKLNHWIKIIFVCPPSIHSFRKKTNHFYHWVRSWANSRRWCCWGERQLFLFQIYIRSIMQRWLANCHRIIMHLGKLASHLFFNALDFCCCHFRCNTPPLTFLQAWKSQNKNPVWSCCLTKNNNGTHFCALLLLLHPFLIPI